MRNYNLALPFDETYAWENFTGILAFLKQGEKTLFYGFGRKLTFRKLKAGTEGKLLVTSLSLSEPEEKDLSSQRRFEKVFMTEILKEPNRHFHIYERSQTKHKDWHKQIYRCIDPDCSHYTQAQFIIGKKARCHECRELITIDKAQVKNFAVRGLCCAKSKKAEIHRKAQEISSNLLFDLDAPLEKGVLSNEFVEPPIEEILKEFKNE